MIQSRNLVPLYITENSRDFHVFLRLLDLVTNNSKAKSDDFISILNPDKCPDILLPLLASYFGYEYDYNETYDKNRTVLKSYRNMIKNKGSVIGVNLAIATAITMLIDKSIIDAQSLFDVAYYDSYYYCINCNYTSYTHFDECPNCGLHGTALKNNDGAIVAVIDYPIYSSKVYDLIEAVRPAGTGCSVHHGTLVEQLENIGISDFIALQSKYLNVGTSEVGGKDAIVGFTTILNESSMEMKYCESCGNLFKLSYYMTSDATKQNDKTYYIYDESTETYTEYNDAFTDGITYIETEDTEKKTWKVYYIYNSQTSEYEKYDGTIFIEGETYYEQFIVYELAESCPYCGSEDFRDSNNSNLRLLYRLYNNDKEYNSIVRNIINNIDTYEDGKPLIENNSDIVGIILNVHINNSSGLVLTNDEEPYIYVYTVTSDSSRVSGKNYYRLNPSNESNDEYVLFEGTDSEWIALKAIDGIFDRTKYSKNKLYFWADGSQASFEQDGSFIPNMDYYEKTTYWNIVDFLQSFIFGLKPYIKIKTDNGNKKCFEYDIKEILDNITEMNNTVLSVMKNKYKNEISYKFLKRQNKDNTYTYVMRASTETVKVSGTDTYIINSHDYLLKRADITRMNYNSIIDGVPQEIVTTITDFVSDNTQFDFKLGASDDYPRKSVDEPTTEVVDNEIISNLLMKEENTSDVTDNEEGYYFNVCNACGNKMIRKGNDSVVICPKCGGIESIKVTTSSGGENTHQITDPTILVGSYMLDLYFE